MVIDASGMTTDMEASFLLRENYTRLSPLIPPGVSLALDDPSTLSRQLQYAQDTDIDKAVAFARRITAEPAEAPNWAAATAAATAPGSGLI